MKRTQSEVSHSNLIICGHLIRIEIMATTHLGIWSDPDICSSIDTDSIEQALRRNELGGALESEICVPAGVPRERTVVGFTARWYRTYDYRQFHSLFRWWWNHSFAEALTEEDFKTQFGTRMGEHYFEKWRLYERNIPCMIGYFGDGMQNGQDFLDLIARKVVCYEDNRKQQPLCVGN